MPEFAIPAPAPVALTIHSSASVFPVRRVYCIGRNYADHAREMGHDPDREPPFFFQKNPDNLDTSDRFPYPPASTDVHFEVELLVALRAGGSDIAAGSAMGHVWGYAVALDMTRRDLQAQAKAQGRPWEIAKAFEHSAPVGPLVPAKHFAGPSQGAISLALNGQVRQAGDLAQMIWSVPEIIATLSQFFTLAAGDVILTGTPAGVGSVQVGDVMVASVAGLPELQVLVV